MADRFLLFDLLTRTVVTELPVIQSMSYTETLNQPGSWSASIPLNANVSAADLYSSRACFAFERGEILRWAGPLLTARIDVGAGVINLSGEGFMNYLRRRLLYETKIYNNVDQLLIVKDLIDYAQTFWGSTGDLGIQTSVLSTIMTVGRDRTFYYYERKKIGELIEQLSAVRNGFDFRLTPRWTNGPNSTMVLDFGVTYPSFGRPTGYVIDVNAHDLTNLDVDLTKLAFAVVASGQGTGEEIPAVAVNNPDLIASNIVLEDAVTVGDVTETSTLTDYANRRLDLGSAPLIYPKFRFPANTIGTFIPGDQVVCIGKAGPLDIGGIYRIVEQTFSLPSEGGETIDLTLAPLAAWSV